MSHFATPFIVINLGCEMVYVIDQRLQSQNVPADKAERVLTDIVTVLLHPKLLDELFIPQPVGSHTTIRQLLQDISATSIMKLDDYSLSKLWDLMTMIFKWQLSVTTCQNIFDISCRHLRNIASLMPEYFSKAFIENALRRFEILSDMFTDEDFKALNNTLILWFSEYHTKISVLIRLGLQHKDGTLSLPSTIDSKILHNLGENIYKYDMKRYFIDENSTDTNSGEIKCLLSKIDKVHHDKKSIKLQLPIEFGTNEKKTLEINKNQKFQYINTNIKNRENDLIYTAHAQKSTQDDLLQMLEDDMN
ncbi:protein OSCP1 [Aricia agestis]|uniref:protein OSCP1 n=1 Tax=Aricia agestis TaxID=91739 RepID=UPI001C2057D2|nr:protein OSCP1 [Aricia agestis]